MKRFALALLCIVSVAFFASCSKDDDKAGNPTINFVQDEGYISSGDTIEALTPYMFGIQAKSNETTKELLTKCFIQVLRGEERVYDTLVDNINQNQYNFDGQIALPEGDYTIIATVHNDKDMTAECRMTITSLVSAQPLQVNDIEWVKTGHNVQDLSAYGLEWKTTNYKDPFTHILPAEGCMLFACSGDGDKFAEINTDLDLAAEFSRLQEMTVLPSNINTTEYNKVDCNPADKDYNDLLITKDAEGNFHAILIKHATVGSAEGATRITITGEAK